MSKKNITTLYRQTNTLNLGSSITYSNYDPKPEAHITKSKNRLRLYSGTTVYLKDESHFEIELFNPKTVRVLAKISVNGKVISGGGIIVNPGQRVYLERFIDEDRKFKFSTYEVEDTEIAKSAVFFNGNIKVDFYSEIDSQMQYMPYAGQTWTADPVYGGSTVNTLYCSTNAAVGNLTLTSSVSAPVAGSLETGRVEKGAKSDQGFTNSYGTFNSWTCSVYQYKILPESQKPVEIGEIRSYCTGCGTRIKKSNWQFCPSCGTPLSN
jgi:hypothetical protein